ncbi:MULTISPECIES: hypothetical protein [unclassified Sulfitobacter]|uniref:hypothetical protein n=3 Tax=Sulfitobacter TaxID=60136 RepID=UPI0007C2F36D|nr:MULTISPECIES: hypothetical protein [unclassified Sulfitobacter]KZY04362.1 hypothetical protein A3721_16695 [Sulfitobacter sp. HI0023]KZZ63122.1 hypothetical protein A3764_05750 [Sulfitobacter sp. HI0129]
MSDQKEEAVSAQLAASLLTPFVLYMAGRIDAADRRATLLAGGGVAFIAYLLEVGKSMDPAILPLIPYLVSLGLAAASVFTAGLALFPRISNADDWPSKIFLGREEGAGILETILTSEKQALSGMIDSQIVLGRILKKKNGYTYHAGILMLLSFALFMPFSFFLG